MAPSKAYTAALAAVVKHHATSKTYSGSLIRPHKHWIGDVVRDFCVRSALDYGCGKGVQYEWRDPSDDLTLEDFWRTRVVKYDPGVPQFSALPSGTFDLVLCTHVLGSIPTVDLSWFLSRLFGYANRVVYISERIGKSNKTVLSESTEWTADQWRTAIGPFVPSGIACVLMTRTKGEDGTHWARSTWLVDSWVTEQIT